MPEWRQDPVTGNQVIIAAGRSKRPHDQQGQEVVPDRCIFCDGNEAKTPPEVLAYRPLGGEPNTAGWVVRAFPNKFPVVTGHHEVIVDCPDHALSFGRLPDRHAELVIKAIGDRYRALAAKSGVKYIQVFKNCGVAAGASLEHTHWQVISIPVIPDMLVREYDQIQSYRRQHGSCGFCRLAQGELNRQGIIESHADYLVTAPFVSRFPHEIWVIPRRHEPDFGCLGAGGAGTLGRILRRTLRRLERALNYPPYNLIIHTKPLTGSYPEFHWHIEILPRLTAIAGFELGTGIFINPVPPHESAALLRGTDPEIRRDPERNGGNSHG